ncbi:helix-turn-helix transcriptional regulator [Streptomyces sp. NPDC005900]|uniref:helix-turn-helix domain-containing protein n=1 Tax=Streptomyces sp. NPDC005900 TaxID=3154569 RepID=UPI0033D5F5DE
MARPEQPIRAPDPELRALAEWLRTQRRTAGLTHRQMAAESRHAFSATTFSRAASGNRVPRLPVVEAYARACGAPVGEARRLWRAARYAEHRRRDPRAEAPAPDRVHDRAELNRALRALYHRAGAMPLGEMERRAGRHGELPHSTVLRMLAGSSTLAADQLMAFLEVCGVTDGAERIRWRDAWRRARRHQERARMGSRLTRAHEALAQGRGSGHGEPGPGPAIRWPAPYPPVGLAIGREQRAEPAPQPPTGR